ncbi:MAG: GNAT family N-acetyltransferase [Pleurocapsa sp. MO_192.B19]|nr:GNAT family N-acetyltransferase [Pleurocapsa sp. MO_192.B19]
MIQLRKYQPKDWDAIATIHDRARLDELNASVGAEAFLSLAETAEDEELFEGEVWVAEDNDLVVGFVAIDSEMTWITWLYVLPDRYRQGIGRRLLRQAIANCKTVVYTSVLSGNNAAQNLYQSEGFEIIETKTGKLCGNESFLATGHILQLDQKQSPIV